MKATGSHSAQGVLVENGKGGCSFGEDTPQHGLDLEQLYIFWATSFCWWGKYQLRFAAARETLESFGCPSKKEEPVMVDWKSVTLIYFCWRSDFTLCLLMHWLLSVLQKKAHTIRINYGFNFTHVKRIHSHVWMKEEGASAEPDCLLMDYKLGILSQHWVLICCGGMIMITSTVQGCCEDSLK